MHASNARPLSIAMMIETVGLGGAEMVVLQLSEELRARGHVVHPVVPHGHEGWLLDRFRESGFRWHTYRPDRPIDPWLHRRMADMLRALQVDVLHSHEYVMGVYGTAAARRMRRPHVITMHGNQDMVRKWQRRVALRWAFRRSHATVAVSEDTRRHLEETLGLRRGTVRVVPNGIPAPNGAGEPVRRELELQSDDVFLLAVGSLVPRKGHAILLEALHRIHVAEPSLRWRLAIAGQGDERPRLEQLIESYGLNGRARLLGPRNDVADLQAAADVFVMPSLWEGLPLAILEAMFASNAIVASRTSGIPEAIDDDVNGLLVPPGDVEALAAALRRLIGSAADRDRLGKAAHARALARHSIGVMTDAYEAMYRGG